MGIDDLTRSERGRLRELLVLSVARSEDPDRLEVLDRAVRRAPVTSLPDAAVLHRVSGTVERSLAPVDSVPPAVLQDLRDDASDAAMHGLITVGALLSIKRAFDDAGLTWIVMKGPVVAHLYYPRPSDRSFADLDLLVPRVDFPKAVGILQNLGFEHTIHNWKLHEELLAGQVEMISPSVLIDLHWHLHYSGDDQRRFALNPEAMIERARTVTVAGMEISTFDEVDTLLNLAFHAARSGGHRLIWLKDIDRAITVDRPSFDELAVRSEAAGCAPAVGLVLERTRLVLGTEIPESLIARLTPRWLRDVDRAARRVCHPVPLHERVTATRASMRLTDGPMSSIPGRVVHRVNLVISPPPINETDDPIELQRYFDAVVSSSE